MSIKLLDNKQNGSVVDELRKSVEKDCKLSVISAYFTIYAYKALKKELDKVEQFRLIFTEPHFTNDDVEAKEFSIQHNFGQIQGNEYEMVLRNEMKQAAISRECAEWLSKKSEIKSFRKSNPAQPRMILCENNNSEKNICINGTVDFTTDGLGITASDRIDNNMCIDGSVNTKAFIKSFNMLWDDDFVMEDVKDKVLEYIQVLYKENTPEFIYYINLYNIFKEYIGELTDENIVKTKTGFQDTEIWNKLYKFQKDGVLGAIDKIEKYNGCIIADSVGLGKTFEALAIIKYYELRNDRVLVLAPKKLHENWSIYTQNDIRNVLGKDRFNFDVLNHTDLSRYSGKTGDIDLSTINWQNYDLLVIDESHNFRNNSPVKDRVTRYQRLMDDVIKAGVKTKVLMLSATPVNNRMNDLKNQIAFITEGDNSALEKVGIDSIEMVLRKAQAVFNRWSELDEINRTTERFLEMMDLDYFKLLDTLTIARSRKHIEKYYNLEEIGKFPERLSPINMYSEIDNTGEFPSIAEINTLIKKLTLGIYSPLKYVLPEKKIEYEKKYDMEVKDGQSVFKMIDRESNLVGLMRVNLLKRMESSIHSFKLTCTTVLDNINTTLRKIDENYNDFDLDINIEDIDPDDSDLENELIGNKVKVLLKDMDLIRWKQDLLDDREKLEGIIKKASLVTPDKDAKLCDLKNIIKNKIQHPINTENKKIIIFTAFADTANYLYENLYPMISGIGLDTAIVTGSGVNHTTIQTVKNLDKRIRLTDINTLLTLFAPKAKEKEKVYPGVTSEIDVLIATDCISEGQNLQDCDYLINYDIHWNPVRIIQRFGRIDRIGSHNDVIQLVNFWPMKDLDEYINLQQRVQGRMVLLDVSATGEENIISKDGGKEMKDLEYRRKQLEQLQNEVVDLEDISGGISITDLTFNDFKMDLAEALKNRDLNLSDAPSGIYAVAKIDESLRSEIEPGIIFTLKQLRGKDQSKEQNAIFPYYLAYVTQNGEIKLSFLQGKKILDIFKKLCKGKSDIYKDLVDLFNSETKDGTEMKEYSDLLELAIIDLVGKKQDVGVASLFSKGGTTMQKDNYDGIEDFELVSFLVLK